MRVLPFPVWLHKNIVMEVSCFPSQVLPLCANVWLAMAGLVKSVGEYCLSCSLASVKYVCLRKLFLLQVGVCKVCLWKSFMLQLKQLGHSVDKVEFIVMGGTFMSLPDDYRDYFIRSLHDALSGHTSCNVEEAVKWVAHCWHLYLHALFTSICLLLLLSCYCHDWCL